MNVGFTVRCCAGTAEIQMPSVEQGATQAPLVTMAQDEDAQLAIVLMGRLDYHEEVTARLSCRGPGAETSDAAVALAVYRHAGLDGLKQLEGEFSLVVWDGSQQRLIGMRDPFGAWPLYWSVRNSVLAMSTSLRQLAADRAEVDLEYVAEFLTRPFVPTEVPCARTAFREVERVRPGTLVVVGADGRSQCHGYWDWLSRLEGAREERSDDAAEHFRSLLDQAVRRRMRGSRIAAHLSGGMDSSSVAILARQALAESTGRAPLVTVSLTYQTAELAGERSYIDLVLKQGESLEPHFLPADGAVGFDWFTQGIPQHDEPYVGLWSLSTNRLLVDVPQQCGVSTVLTGVGGDEILTYRPLHIADLVRRGRLVAGFREASTWAEAQGEGVWSVFRRCGLAPLWPRFSWWSIPPWISDDFARKYQLRDRIQEFARLLSAPPCEFSETRNRLGMTSGDWARWYLHAPLGINISHPFLDPRVVCYALSIPRKVRACPGAPKPVLEAAMRGLLPDAILNRREKTGFNGPHSRGLARNFASLEKLIHHSRIGDWGLIDTNKLLASMQRVAVGVGIKHNESMDRTLALIAWLDQQ